MNLFSYCENNPVCFSDSYGLCVWDLLDIYFAADSINCFIYDPSITTFAYAFFDVLALLPVLPSSGYYRYGSEAFEIISRGSCVASKTSGLLYAEKYGIHAYGELRKALKGTGLEAHHIIEKRFADRLGVAVNDMLCVAVTKEEHQAFTNAWRKLIPYGTDYSTLTLSEIWDAAKSVYCDYPDLLEIAKRTIYPKGAR